MGVMLSAAGSLQWFRDRLAPGTSFARSRRRGRGMGAGRRGAPLCAVSRRRAHAARRSPRPGAFTGLELRHDRGALVRAVLEGVAFGLRDSLELVRGARRSAAASAAPRAAERAAGSGSRSSPRCSACRSSCTAVEEGSAYGAALLGGVAAGRRSPTSPRRSPDASGSALRSSPTPPGSPPTRSIYPRFGALYPALDTVKETSVISLEGKVAVVTGASRGIGAAVARLLADQGVKLGLASRSRRRPRHRRAQSRKPTRRARPRAGVGARRRDGGAPRWHRHRDRERRRRRLRPVRRASTRPTSTR